MRASARGRSGDPFRPATHRIASWDDVASLIDHFSFHRGVPWLFRGVSSTRHDLIPLVGRPGWRRLDRAERGHRGSLDYSYEDELAVFNMFRNTAVPFLEHQPTSQMEWLAVARHFGVPTRFLDWTERFLVAMWFAAYGAVYESEGEDEPGIWVIWNLKSVSARDLDNPFQVKSPRGYRPPHIVPRFSAQGSVLSIHGDPTKPLPVKERILITVERRACFALMKRLDDCGLNFATVYPGIDGLGRYLRWRYENAWLAGY